ncbi:hypothetical protein PIB30_095245, partial [Stylosanthes scabra]|nr:hypothetical protein [Stylosanthes scabra]
AWNITPRRGQASSSTQNPNLGVEASQAGHKNSRVHAYAWKSTLMRGSYSASPEPHEAHAYAWNPTHMRGKLAVLGRIVFS